MTFFFFQAEDGIRDLVRSRGLGDVYKRQILDHDEVFGRRILSEKLTAAVVVEPEAAAAVRVLSLIHI